MKKVILFILAVLMTVGVVSYSGVVSETAMAAECDASFLGLRPWYKDLPMDTSCAINSPTEDQLPKFVWTIVANVVYDVMLVVGVVAVGFIIFGGYLYMTSGGDPVKAAKAKNVLTAAVVGLLISVLATVIINTIMGILNPTAGGA